MSHARRGAWQVHLTKKHRTSQIVFRNLFSCERIKKDKQLHGTDSSSSLSRDGKFQPILTNEKLFLSTAIYKLGVQRRHFFSEANKLNRLLSKKSLGNCRGGLWKEIKKYQNN